jgi:hypothetical protein
MHPTSVTELRFSGVRSRSGELNWPQKAIWSVIR